MYRNTQLQTFVQSQTWYGEDDMHDDTSERNKFTRERILPSKYNETMWGQHSCSLCSSLALINIDGQIS